jgi:hypothetical protein
LPTTQRPNINPSSRSISLIQIVAHLSPRSSRYTAGDGFDFRNIFPVERMLFGKEIRQKRQSIWIENDFPGFDCRCHASDPGAERHQTHNRTNFD